MTHLKRPWCWERLRAGGEGDTGWDGWMALPTQWTWVWVNSRSWRWTGKPSVPGLMGLQRFRHDWLSELNWSEVKVAQSCLTLYNPMGSIVHGILQCQNSGVGSLSLLHRIFPTQGSNPGLPHYWWILYQLWHKGSQRILEWVAYLFSSRSSWPGNWKWVSCIPGQFLTNWAIREAQKSHCRVDF